MLFIGRPMDEAGIWPRFRLTFQNAQQSPNIGSNGANGDGFAPEPSALC